MKPSDRRSRIPEELFYSVKRSLPPIKGCHVPLIVRKMELPRHTTTTIRFELPHTDDHAKFVKIKWNKDRKFFTVVKRL